MPLTAIQIHKAVPRDKPYKLFDAGGLYLLVQPNAAKWWRLKYRFGGKEKLLALGTLDEVSLKQAPEKRDEARSLVSAGTDPSEARKAEAADAAARDHVSELAAAGIALPGTFDAVAREWHQRVHSAKVSEGHAARTLIRFEQDVFPWIGKSPIGQVSAPVLLDVLRRVERRGDRDDASHQRLVRPSLSVWRGLRIVREGSCA